LRSTPAERCQAMPEYVFEFTERFKPAVRMTQRSKYEDDRAQEYLATQGVLAARYREQMNLAGWEMLPERTPIFVEVEVQMASGLHIQDGDNQYKALTDSAQGIVFKDDRWIDGFIFLRSLGDHNRVIITYRTKDGDEK
jgi:Holliday junction resolvase RusA-like endonuclease